VSLDSVRAFFAETAPDIAIIELEVSTATVAEAAAAHGVEPGQIAKTLSLRAGDRIVLLVTTGDARLDNAKAKAAFGGKVRMLDLAEVEGVTGHPVGGVCPLRSGDAPAGLLRCVVEGLGRGDPGGRGHPLGRPHQP